MPKVQRILRAAYYAVAALPVAFAPTGVRARVTRRVFQRPFALAAPGIGRTIAHTLLAAAVGLVAWLVVFLATIAFVRGVAYPLFGADGYEHSWGGPTLAGAWAVHAALGVGLLPVWAVLLAGIGLLQLRLVHRVLGRSGPWWPVPIAVALFLGGVVFFIAWLHQV
ncbi:hypothetical protein [Nocardia huaxiensis]|uniref:hypothetical protein n=1 Tax=Nocardia huaxiensis TaxID=2755382 RepID=UPI001E28BEBF|nr:hypothetical protein [Nocardia huaxiensis]UFS98570.1 hypothetical protein LPY97_12045 [Nocardia huaxiensis]